MKKLISSVVIGCLSLSPIKALADFKTVTLEPEQSPPIPANNYYVRAEGYTYPALYVKNGILVSLKLGRSPQDTYLSDSSGVDRSILTEVNCKTGEGLVVATSQNNFPSPIKHQAFNLSQSQASPYTIAISYACSYYLKK